MAKVRRRGYPANPTEEQRDPKYGKRGTARATRNYKERKDKKR